LLNDFYLQTLETTENGGMDLRQTSFSRPHGLGTPYEHALLIPTAAVPEIKQPTEPANVSDSLSAFQNKQRVGQIIIKITFFFDIIIEVINSGDLIQIRHFAQQTLCLGRGIDSQWEFTANAFNIA
jgi:hypothetical protein